VSHIKGAICRNLLHRITIRMEVTHIIGKHHVQKTIIPQLVGTNQIHCHRQKRISATSVKKSSARRLNRYIKDIATPINTNNPIFTKRFNFIHYTSTTQKTRTLCLPVWLDLLPNIAGNDQVNAVLVSALLARTAHSSTTLKWDIPLFFMCSKYLTIPPPFFSIVHFFILIKLTTYIYI